MPELPEVETIARNLRSGSGSQPAIVGLQIHRAILLWERTLAEPSADQFSVRVPGQAIIDVHRRGKFLRLQLSGDNLLFHLRMSGDLVVDRQDSETSLHQRLYLDLDQGLRLSFVDPRKFGRAWLVDDEQKVLAGLGPEPLDEGFNAPVLFAMLHARRRQLKPLLLDQTFIAGLGNIYTDEALHLAKLHPLALSDQLNFSDAHNLLASIRQVLQEGIRRNGASIDWVYRGGDFQNYFRVYQRTGEACLECGAAIQRIVVGQRGTHFCPVCQPAPTDSRL